MKQPNKALSYLLTGITAATMAFGTPSAQAKPTPTPSKPKTVQADHTHYVDQDATGADNGDTWQDAYTTLQDALNEARQTPGDDDIYVAEGTYYPDQGQNTTDDDRNASFNVPSGVNLYGRFNGDEAAPSDRVLDRGANPTTLSGEIQQDNQDNNNAYTVLKLNGGTIDNVRIANGNANGDREQRRGGGIDATSGRIQNTWVQQNRAEQGGGIYITGTTSLENVLVNENQAPTASGVLSMRGASNITNATITDDVTIVDNNPTTTTDNTRITNSALTGNTEVLTPTQRTVTLDVHEVGEDLYDGGDAPGELEQVQVTVDGQTYTANTTNGTGTVAFPTTQLTDNVRVSVDDEDYLDTYMLNNTETETAPDLTITGPDRTAFPDEPDYQSNYDPETAGPNTGNGTAGNATNGLANTDIPLTDLESSLEVRVIPLESPKGKATDPNFTAFAPQFRRWTDLDGNQELITYRLETSDGSEELYSLAQEAHEKVNDVLPVPSPDEAPRVTVPELQDLAEQRNFSNFSYIEYGSPGNYIDQRGRFAEDGYASSNTSRGLGTMLSEVYSSKFGVGTRFEDGVRYEPGDIIFGPNAQDIGRDGEFLARICYSIKSSIDIE